MHYESDRAVSSNVLLSGTQSTLLQLLCELGQATTAYHEATPDRVEIARLEYEAALYNFKSFQSPDQLVK